MRELAVRYCTAFQARELVSLSAPSLQLGPLLKAEQSQGMPSMHSNSNPLAGLKSSESLGGLRGSLGGSQQVDGQLVVCLFVCFVCGFVVVAVVLEGNAGPV